MSTSPSLTATSVATESECAPSDANIGWATHHLNAHLRHRLGCHHVLARSYSYACNSGSSKKKMPFDCNDDHSYFCLTPN